MITQRTYSTLLKYSHHAFKNNITPANKFNFQNFKKGVMCFLVGYGVSIILIKNNYKYGMNSPNSAVDTFWNSGDLEPKYRDSLYWAGF